MFVALLATRFVQQQMKINFSRTSASILSLSALAALSVSAAPLQPNTSPRQRLNFNAGWRFQKGESGGDGALGQGYNIQKWRWKSGQELSALTEDTSGATWKDAASTDDVFNSQRGFAWFRTTLPARALAPSVPLVLRFSGVDDNATVVLNGQKLATHEGWDSPFDVSIKQAWKQNAPNELAVLVENGAGVGGIGTVGLQIGAPTPPLAGQIAFNDRSWRALNLPHDWGIEESFDQELPGESGKLPWAGVGWYRKHFSLGAPDAGKKIFLDIDGAMSNASVWVNGKSVGGWPYGYASFQLDLTPFVKSGGNVVAIRLDNAEESSRWYPGGGVYRNVWLQKTSPTHIAHWGVTVTTPQISSSSATVQIAAQIEKPNPAAPVRVRTDIFRRGANGQKTGAVLSSSQVVGTGAKQTLKLQLPSPQLWTIQKPALYVAQTTLSQGGKTLDSYDTTFGVRTIKWDAAQGFLLNGRQTRINGVCMHHDLGALGAAWNTRAMERRIEILQEMGCNAIRTSHNPPAPEFLDLCDRMGVLVMDEFADTWTRAKKRNGYAKIFADWSERDVRALVRRDRNHPSVILWSSGNEVGEQSEPVYGVGVSQRLTNLFHQEDPTRPVSAGVSDSRGGYNGFQKTLDVMGFNYKPWEYARFRVANPTQPVFGSETSSTVSSRGEYVFPVSNNRDAGESDFQVSSYDLYYPGWATTPDREFADQDRNPFVAGEFVWTGFDYLGEPTPYNNDVTNLLNYHTPQARAAAERELAQLGKIRVPSRSSYFGIVDLAGFKKDRFFLYQAHWRPDFPMAHILPHWNWAGREGETTPVHVYTSGDEAELFLNGTSLGRKKKAPFEYRLRWDDVKYQPGELRVVTFKNGAKWAEKSLKTSGVAARISLQSDRNIIRADGHDLSFITVAVSDANGQMVPTAQNETKFEISGPGEIVATDNGDATDLRAFSSKSRRAFNGLAQVIVRGKSGQKGQIRVRATANGLTSGAVVGTSR